MSVAELVRGQLDMDRRSLAGLRDAGDRSNVVRAIDHTFFNESREPLDNLAPVLQALGLVDVSVSSQEHDGKHYFLLESQFHSPCEAPFVSHTACLMRLLAAHYRVGYDGWGCPVESE